MWSANIHPTVSPCTMCLSWGQCSKAAAPTPPPSHPFSLRTLGSLSTLFLFLLQWEVESPFPQDLSFLAEMLGIHSAQENKLLQALSDLGKRNQELFQCPKLSGRNLSDSQILPPGISAHRRKPSTVLWPSGLLITNYPNVFPSKCVWWI